MGVYKDAITHFPFRISKVKRPVRINSSMNVPPIVMTLVHACSMKTRLPSTTILTAQYELGR